MGAIEKVSNLLAMPAVESGLYRCGNCGATAGSDETSCPDCGGETQVISEPVQYVYREPF